MRRGRWVPLLLALVLTVLVSVPLHAATPRVVVNGSLVSFDVAPVIEQGRMLVPLRAIFEALGAEIYWDDESKTVSALRGDVAIAIQIGNPVANKNNSPVMLDVPAKIQNGRTLVPLRFIGEAFGCDVKWDEATSTAIITDTPPLADQAASLVGLWSISPSGWDVVDGAGNLVRAGYSTEFYLFRSDGTYRFAIAGSGSIISGVVIENGTWSFDGEQLLLSNRLQSWTPDPTHTGQQPAYKDKPFAEERLTVTFNGPDEAVFQDGIGLSNTYYRRPETQ